MHLRSGAELWLLTSGGFVELYGRLSARRSLYRLNHLLYRCAIRGLGCLHWENFRATGEDAFVRSVVAGRDNPLTVFDVGAYHGDYAKLVRHYSPTAQITVSSRIHSAIRSFKRRRRRIIWLRLTSPALNDPARLSCSISQRTMARCLPRYTARCSTCIWASPAAHTTSMRSASTNSPKREASNASICSRSTPRVLNWMS